MSPDVHTLAGAYVLGAVDDLEGARFREHLDSCPACAREVAELEATAARLSDLVETAPPPGLRAAVLAEIGRTRQVGPGRRVPPGHPGRWRRLAVAAAAVLVAGAGAGAVTYQIEEQRVRAARAQSAEASRIAAVLGAPDAVVRSQPATGGGQVTVVVSAARREGVAIVSGLQSPGAGHSYQLWLLRGAGATNTGAVLTSGTGRQLLTDVAGADAFAVSRETGTAVVPAPSNDLVGTVKLA